MNPSEYFIKTGCTCTELKKIFNIKKSAALNIMSKAIESAQYQRKMELIIESGAEWNPESEIEHININYQK